MTVLPSAGLRIALRYQLSAVIREKRSMDEISLWLCLYLTNTRTGMHPVPNVLTRRPHKPQPPPPAPGLLFWVQSPLIIGVTGTERSGFRNRVYVRVWMCVSKYETGHL